MSYRRNTLTALLLGAAGLLAACSDQSTAPEVSALTPRFNVSRDVGVQQLPVSIQALLRDKALPKTVTVSKKIPNGGGNIDIPGTDFTLQIPKGAFEAKDMTFTITAYSGYAVAYDFQPHGTVFLKPLRAVQKLDHTSWGDLKLPSGFYQAAAGAYFSDSTQVDFETGAATVNEFMSTGADISGRTLSWDVPHFSGYIVSWGRR